MVGGNLFFARRATAILAVRRARARRQWNVSAKFLESNRGPKEQVRGLSLTIGTSWMPSARSLAFSHRKRSVGDKRVYTFGRRNSKK